MDKEKIKDSLAVFSKEYSPEKLKDKLGAVAKKAGVKTVYAVLLLYYALMDKEVPFKSKVIVMGSLGYFIFPTDLIPDLLGPLGFTDDLAALLFALRSIWNNISPRTHEKARKRLEEWFGEVKNSDLKLFSKDEVEE